jgi:hypothetical protein
MSQHSSMSLQAQERVIAREQTTTHIFPMLTRLEIALRQAENTERVAKQNDHGDLWYKAWKRALDLREQIAMLGNMWVTR